MREVEDARAEDIFGKGGACQCECERWIGVKEVEIEGGKSKKKRVKKERERETESNECTPYMTREARSSKGIMA
jgi:hypothetical protein